MSWKAPSKSWTKLCVRHIGEINRIYKNMPGENSYSDTTQKNSGIQQKAEIKQRTCQILTDRHRNFSTIQPQVKVHPSKILEKLDLFPSNNQPLFRGKPFHWKHRDNASSCSAITTLRWARHRYRHILWNLSESSYHWGLIGVVLVWDCCRTHNVSWCRIESVDTIQHNLSVWS